MARLISTIASLCLCTASYCQAAGHIGADLAKAAESGNLRITTGYSFSEPWSAEAGVSLGLNGRTKEYDIGFRYWCRKYGEGLSIYFGGISGESSYADIRISAGYSLKIWKGLGLDIGYGIRLFSTVNGGDPRPEDLTLDITYRFEL